MKRLSIICGVFLVFAVSARAQENHNQTDTERPILRTYRFSLRIPGIRFPRRGYSRGDAR